MRISKIFLFMYMIFKNFYEFISKNKIIKYILSKLYVCTCVYMYMMIIVVKRKTYARL